MGRFIVLACPSDWKGSLLQWWGGVGSTWGGGLLVPTGATPGALQVPQSP